MGARASRGGRFVAAVGLSFVAMATAPVACFFPTYTFQPAGNEGGSSSSTGMAGSSSSAASTGSMGGIGGATASSSNGSSGGGGVTASGTSSSSSASSSSGTGCASKSCSDPACATSFQCMATTPPAGWTGYYALYQGAESGYDGCSSEFPVTSYKGNAGISFEPATCNCTCVSPTGQQCELSGPVDTNQAVQMKYPGAIDAIVAHDAPCDGTSMCGGLLADLPTWNGTCDITYISSGTMCGANGNCQPGSSGNPACDQSISVQPLQVTGGSCTANAQPPTVPPVVWATLGAACGGAVAGTGCSAATDSCLPIPQGPFVGGLCIMQAGDVGCPGGFGDKHLFYGSSNLPSSTDTRTCTACGCGAPTGGTCSASVKIYSGQSSPASCTAGTLVATLNPTTATADCVNTPSNPAIGSKQVTFSAVTGGTCASTSTPTGTATPINPTTFCCTQ